MTVHEQQSWQHQPLSFPLADPSGRTITVNPQWVMVAHPCYGSEGETTLVLSGGTTFTVGVPYAEVQAALMRTWDDDRVGPDASAGDAEAQVGTAAPEAAVAETPAAPEPTDAPA